MKKSNLLPPTGMRDFLPQEVKRRERALNIIREVFESFGFLPMDTPALERTEILMGKYGSEGEKLIFRILKRGEQAISGESDLALRYDLTVPLARFFARYQNELPRPFRRYQIGPVWRADRPGKGRFREFYQCDIDIVNSPSLLADADIVLALVKILSRFNLSNFVILLNSRKVLAGIIEAYGVPKSLQEATLINLDKIDKIGTEGVICELKKIDLPPSIMSQFECDLRQVGNDLENKIRENAIGREGLREVEELTSLLTPVLKGCEVKFSPLLVRGLNYYTGPIFEIYLKGRDGAIASGGRYDNLIEMFTEKRIPACGGSLGIDRLMSMVEISDDQEEQPISSLQVFVTLWDGNFRTDVVDIAEELRNSGISVEISLEEGKIGNQIRLALKRGARFCLFYGPDEKSKNEITIKDLQRGEQLTVKRNELTQKLKSLIQKR